MLVYFVRSRKDIPFPLLFWLFGAFIIGCGTTHLMEVLTTSIPVYRLSGLIKLVTALVSIATAITLGPFIPKVLAMRTPTELEAEIARRKEAEANLIAAYAELEQQVQERTLSLRRSEERYRLLIENHPDAIMVNDGEKVVFANRAAADLLGRRSPAELLGRSHLDYVHSHFHAVIRNRWEKVFATGHPAPKLEQTWLRADGSTVTVEVAVYLLPGSGKQQLQIVARDITERKRSEEYVRIAVEAAPNGMLMVGEDGTICLANEQVRKMFGYTAEQLLDQPVEILVPQRWRANHSASRAAFFVNPQSRGMGAGRELFGLRKDGTEFPVEVGLQPIRLHESQFVLASIIDVTERRQAEIALRESEARFRFLTEMLPCLVWTNLPDGYNDFQNQRWIEYTGLTLEESRGEGWAMALHPDDLERTNRRWTHSLRTGEAYQIEYRLRRGSDGSYRWFLGQGLPMRDEAGQIVRWFGACTDIDDQKQAEEQLQYLNASLELRVAERTEAIREQEERFRSAFDHAPIGMALVAPNGRWLRVNRSLCEMVGYTEAELLATDFQSITHPDDLEADLGFVRDMLAGTIRIYQMEKRYFHKSGRVIHVLLSVSLVRDAAGVPRYFISQIKDITQRKSAEERVKASLREKEVLLSEIHHRVKNNLQIVSTLLDLQSDYTQDRQALEMFKESRGRVKSMALIHERLYRSQDLASVNLNQYVQQLAEDLYSSYKVSNDEIVLHIEVAVPPLPIDIAIPCGLLLNELMSNSLKHGFKDASEGWIRVTLRSDGPNTVLIVADNGVGFPHGFDFRNTTSFGLQLVNTLVEQLDGEIELNTEQGSEFIVTFPTKDNGRNGTSA